MTMIQSDIILETVSIVVEYYIPGIKWYKDGFWLNKHRSILHRLTKVPNDLSPANFLNKACM